MGWGRAKDLDICTSASSPRAVPSPRYAPCPALDPHPHSLPAPGSSSAHGWLWTSCPQCTMRWAMYSTTCSTRTSLSPCAKAPTLASMRPSGMCWRSPSLLLHTCTKLACWTTSSMTQVKRAWRTQPSPIQTPLHPIAGPHVPLLPSALIVSASLSQARQVWGSTWRLTARPKSHPKTAQGLSPKQGTMVLEAGLPLYVRSCWLPAKPTSSYLDSLLL